MTASTVLVISVIVVLYPYLVYPLMLCTLSAMRWKSGKRSPGADSERPHVTVLICAHNEQMGIGERIQQCLDQDYPTELIRILVVSDGSTDATGAEVRKFDHDKVKLIEVPERIGKAGCLNLGMENILDGIVVLMDVRQSIERGAISALVGWFSDPQVGAVSGELHFRPDSPESAEGALSAYWHLEVFIRKLESRCGSMIGVTGALYAIRRNAFSPIPDNTILDDVLIPMQAIRAGYEVKFESAAIAFDHHFDNPDVERTRKTRTMAGNFQLMGQHRWTLLPTSNPACWRFYSHKVSRLLVPLGIVGIFVSTLILTQQHIAWWIAVVLQLATYLYALCATPVDGPAPIRVFNLARSFVRFHFYVVFGLIHYIENKNAHLWDVSRSGKSG